MNEGEGEENITDFNVLILHDPKNGEGLILKC